MSEKSREVVRYDDTRAMLDQSAKELKKALPKHIPVDRMIRVVMTSVRLNRKLLDCDPMSLLAAVFESSQIGLVPDGALGEAHLVPYGTKCQLIPGYKGLVKLARQSGEIADIYALVVYEGEPFVYKAGLNRTLEHTPLPPSERGEKAVGAYAVAEWRTGDKSWTWMWVEELDVIRDKALSKQTSQDVPWRQHLGEMRKKTAIRRLAKLLPLSPEFQRAAVLDDHPETTGSDIIDMDLGPAEDPEAKEQELRAEEYALRRQLWKAIYVEDKTPASGELDALDRFLLVTAEAAGISRSLLIQQALDDLGSFMESFKKWFEKHPSADQAATGETNGGSGEGSTTTEPQSRSQKDTGRNSAVIAAIRECFDAPLVAEDLMPAIKDIRSRLPEGLVVRDSTIKANWETLKAIAPSATEGEPAPPATTDQPGLPLDDPPPLDPPDEEEPATRQERINALAQKQHKEFEVYDQAGQKGPQPLDIDNFVRGVIPDATDDEIDKALASRVT